MLWTSYSPLLSATPQRYNATFSTAGMYIVGLCRRGMAEGCNLIVAALGTSPWTAYDGCS